VVLRLAAIVTLCCGCDLVFTVRDRTPPDTGIHESDTHDEDGDDIPDARDLCPHLADPQQDFDGDGIGDDCDPHPEDPNDLRYFVSFENGSTEGLMGDVVVPEADSILLGTLNGTLQSLVLPVDVADVTIDVGFEIVADPYEPPVNPPPFAELGLSAVHHAFTTDNKQLGDTCFVGRDRLAPPNYLQFQENEKFHGEIEHRWTGALVGTVGRVQFHRSASGFDCSCTSGINAASDTLVRSPNTATGVVALSANRLQVRLRYLWIVTARPSPASP
jgi:hypothetical protein